MPLLPEKGLVVAGDAVIGADSRTTCTYGALGSVAFHRRGSNGYGSRHGDRQGTVVQGAPPAIKFQLVGKPAKWVSGKDVIL